jgi:hypothetical protein
MMRWLTLVLLSTLTLTACGHVDPDHPFDPDAPASAQHRARLMGRLVGLSEAARPDTEVRLFAGTDAEARYTVGVDAQGQFRFDSVLTGTYRLTVAGPGVALGPRVVDLGPARVVDLGDIALTGEATSGGQSVAGFVRLADRPENRWAGTVVRSSGGAIAMTGADGLFRLTLLPGDAPLLVADYPGYAQGRIALPEAENGEEIQIQEPTVLSPLPGQIAGTVALGQFDTEARRLAVVVTLEPEEGEPLEAEVAADGDFAFADVPAGAWTLHASGTGYDATERPIQLEADETLDLGLVQLSHTSVGPNAVPLAGDVHDQDGTPWVAMPVKIRFASDNTVFAETLTNDAGGFGHTAAPDEVYKITTGPGESVVFGPVAWDPVAERWTDLAGTPIDLTVLRNQ